MAMTKEDRDEFREIIREVVSPIVKLQEEHHRTLFGNGSEGSPGLRVDVDRIKNLDLHAHVNDNYAHGIGLRIKVLAWVFGIPGALAGAWLSLKTILGLGGHHG